MMADELAGLVAKAKAGDRSAFDEVVRATHADTYALAYRLTGNQEDASDVVQDAYLRAYRALKKFRGDSALTTWLYRITANCASTHMARRARARHEDLDEQADMADDRLESNPEEMASAALERDRVTAAVAALPPRLRAVVVLRDVFDLPHEVIATELGISEAAAKVRLHRARKRLRDKLFPGKGEEQARAV